MLLVGMQIDTTIPVSNLEISSKTEDQVIPILGMCSLNVLEKVHKEPAIGMSVAACLIMVKNWRKKKKMPVIRSTDNEIALNSQNGMLNSS